MIVDVITSEKMERIEVGLGDIVEMVGGFYLVSDYSNHVFLKHLGGYKGVFGSDVCRTTGELSDLITKYHNEGKFVKVYSKEYYRLRLEEI